MLVSADYSQIELRLLAHLSGDPAFVHAFQSGGDIHRQTAALIFDVPARSGHVGHASPREDDQLRDDLRAGAHALSRQLKISFAEAKEFIERYFQRFHRVREYLDSMVEFARSTAMCRRSSIAAGTFRSYGIGTSTFGRSVNERPRTLRFRDPPPT